MLLSSSIFFSIFFDFFLSKKCEGIRIKKKMIRISWLPHGGTAAHQQEGGERGIRGGEMGDERRDERGDERDERGEKGR